jgi:hypothetical protein
MDNWTGYMPDRPSEEGKPGLVFDPEQAPKGWNRASLEMKTHPLHPSPKVTQRDLLLPLYADRLVLLGACLACGICIAILWVYFPVFLVEVMSDKSLGDWLWPLMGFVAATTGLLLFALASREQRRYVETL